MTRDDDNDELVRDEMGCCDMTHPGQLKLSPAVWSCLHFGPRNVDDFIHYRRKYILQIIYLYIIT